MFRRFEMKYNALRLLVVLIVLTIILSMCVSVDQQRRAISVQSYYVSTSGSDSNPGTQAQPWKTIQKAANTATAGSTVNIKSGTYNESVRFKVNSGTQAQPIIFKREGTAPVIIIGASVD